MGCLAAAAIAQPPPPTGEGPRPEPPKRFYRHPGPEGDGPAPRTPPTPFYHHLGPEGDAMRDRAMHELQKLSPEKRADLWRAVWAVLNLPPEKRQMVLGMDDERRKIAREEIERTISDNGLQLDEERKKVFVRRYFDERRAIEEKLRAESEEKRRQLVNEMRARLKQEFGSASGAPASPGGPK
jgi:hypothetical protein